MHILFQAAVLLLLLNNFGLLAARGMSMLIRLIAAQGILLALLLFSLPVHADLAPCLIFSLAVLAVKGLLFPRLLRRTAQKVIDEHRLPHLGYNLSTLAGIAAFGFSFRLESLLPLTPGFFPFLLFPAAFTTIVAGCLLVVGRMKALTQVIGYLVAENGIFLLGLPLMAADGGLWFELLVLLDVLVAVFVMGIALNHINSTFESLNVGRFCALRD
jgi:hydrogenase-4 component E